MIDHRVDTKIVVHEKDAYINSRCGQKKRKKTTKGWEFFGKMEKWKYKLDITKRYDGKINTPSS